MLETLSTEWLLIGWAASFVFILVALVFFFGEPIKLRAKMFGRSRMGYGVLEVIHRNGRRIPYAVKFQNEIKIGKFLFKPKFDHKHVFRNEFGMPTIQFNVRSVEPLPIENDEKKEKEEEEYKPDKAIQGKLNKLKHIVFNKEHKTFEDKCVEVGEELQLKPNQPPKSVITDPMEDLQSHMAYFQAGLLKGGGLSDRLMMLLYVCMVASIASAGMLLFLMYYLKVFG